MTAQADQKIAAGLRAAIEPIIEHERNRIHCFGDDLIDDMTEKFWAGRVPAVKLGDDLAQPVLYIVPRDGDNDDD